MPLKPLMVICLTMPWFVYVGTRTSAIEDAAFQKNENFMILCFGNRHTPLLNDSYARLPQNLKRKAAKLAPGD